MARLEECSDCGVTLDSKGMPRHRLTHTKKGAPYLGGGGPRKVKTVRSPKVYKAKTRVRTFHKIKCQFCDLRFDRRGLGQHERSHGEWKPEVAPTVDKPSTNRLDAVIKASTGTIRYAFEIFPKDPLLFNAQTFLGQVSETDNADEQIDALKTCMQYIDLAIQARGGWQS